MKEICIRLSDGRQIIARQTPWDKWSVEILVRTTWNEVANEPLDPPGLITSFILDKGSIEGLNQMLVEEGETECRF